jgi:hypothetical protein
MKWTAFLLLAALSGCADMERHAYEGLQARQHALGQDGSLSGKPAGPQPDYDQYKKERDSYLKGSASDAPAKEDGRNQ